MFHKMCRSLARVGYRTTLVVADGLGDAEVDGVSIRDVGARGGRLRRFAVVPGRVLRVALSVRADIYHLHDPELLPIAARLGADGRRVVFDSHEDVPSQLLDKPYLNRAVARVASILFGAYEAFVCRRLSGVIAATPYIGAKFRTVNPETVVINNFPLRDELQADSSGAQVRQTVCYIGAIAGIRGIEQLVRALALVTNDVRLDLCGEFSDRAAEQVARALPGWARVNERGQLRRAQIRDLLATAVCGIVTFLPLPNHVNAQPNKMFEYMSAGIPVIASDFPLWREIVAGSDCGLMVDPRDPRDIARAIDRLVADPMGAARMGRNGRRAVLEKYNWEAEVHELFSFYGRVLTRPLP